MKKFWILLMVALFLGGTAGHIMAAPLAPELSVTTNGIRVSASWTSVADAAGYTLLFAPSPYTGPESIQSVNMGSQTSIAVDLWVGAAFYVAIQAYGGGGSSDYSNIELFVTEPVMEWIPAPALNTPRDQFGGAVVNGKIYVTGGNRNPDGGNLDTTEVFDPATSTWSYGAPSYFNGGQGAEELSGAAYNNKLYIFGGWGAECGTANLVEEYVPETDQWFSQNPKPSPVSSAPAVLYNGEIFVFGGWYENSCTATDGVPQNMVEAFNPATGVWRSVTTMPITLDGSAIAVHGDRAYLIGGVDQAGSPVYNVMAYDFVADQWITSGLGSLNSARAFPYSSAAPIMDGKIFLIGGWARTDGATGTLSDDNAVPTTLIETYDPGTGAIETFAPLPEGRTDHLSVAIGNSLYVVGGKSGKTNDYTTNKVWKINIH